MKRKEKILKLIENGVANEEIIKTLKINNEILKKEIHELNREGYNIIRQFHCNGTQKYILKKEVSDNITHIIGIPKNDTFRALATSDYHIGSKKQNLGYILMQFDL